jgi:hypothetical protein|tara:strand:+ start:26 stop:127 length:102 start_codon:yes stop_codon:yes gene_type:complete
MVRFGAKRRNLFLLFILKDFLNTPNTLTDKKSF